MDINTFWKLSYGVYIVSAWDDKRPTGCTVNSIMQVTVEPATIAISIHHDNFTHQCIDKTSKFAISILDESSDPSIIGIFGFQSGKDMNKFEQVEYEVLSDMPIVKASCSYITCEVVDRMETPTHTVFLGRVYDANIRSEGKVMTYEYYHKVIKGRSSKNAPTYIEPVVMETNKVEDKLNIYVCSICGYEYSGDLPFEELPDDYVCPICKQPKSVFNKKE